MIDLNAIKARGTVSISNDKENYKNIMWLSVEERDALCAEIERLKAECESIGAQLAENTSAWRDRLATLKPCPFCGGGAIVDEIFGFLDRDGNDTSRFTVHCYDNFKTCVASPSLRCSAEDEESAIAAWNKRRME